MTLSAVPDTEPGCTTGGRRFNLYRYADVSGISGTGVVAEGIEFTDGTVAMRWYGEWASTTLWPSIEAVIAVHGHDGATQVLWQDDQ